MDFLAQLRELLPPMLVAIGRKNLFAGQLVFWFWVVDHTILRGFQTAYVIRNAPLSIAILLGLLAIALAIV